MHKLIVLFLLCFIVAAFAEDTPPDYAREKKWADEILPNVVVGDPVYLTTKSGIKFLSLFTEAKDAKAAVVLGPPGGPMIVWLSNAMTMGAAVMGPALPTASMARMPKK